MSTRRRRSPRRSGSRHPRQGLGRSRSRRRAAREERPRESREQRGREREEREHERELERFRERQRRRDRETSETVLAEGLPEDPAAGVSEERLESVAWEQAVAAGCSMPSGVQFAYDRATQKFRGFAVLVFPHKDAARIFKDHCNSVLQVDGFKLNLKYHHSSSPRSRSRSRSRGQDEPRDTIFIGGLAASTDEQTLISTFQAFATVKDVRHFPRRGFAFMEFHSVEDARTALRGFQRECRNMLDGCRLGIHFAQPDNRGAGPDALVDQLAAAVQPPEPEAQDVPEGISAALTGVNAGMWASYMQSVAQTEQVQSANTFEYDKDSGFYFDAKAGLYYDPNTTYFWTSDASKYFVYCPDEKQLCLVDSQGQQVPGGERRPLPGAAGGGAAARSAGRGTRSPRARSPRGGGRAGARAAAGGRGGERGRSRSRMRDRSRAAAGGAGRDEDERGGGDRGGRRRPPERGADSGGHATRDKDGPRTLLESFPGVGAGPASVHKPIHFPGGDPLAKLAPAPSHAEASQPKVKQKKKAAESVPGLGSSTDHVGRPGRVTVFAQTPGPVVVLSRQQPQQADHLEDDQAAPLPAGGEWICELCMRKFGSEALLRRHEQISDLHRQNLAARGL